MTTSIESNATDAYRQSRRETNEQARSSELCRRLRVDGWVAWKVNYRTVIALQAGHRTRFVAVTIDEDPLAKLSPSRARYHAFLAAQADAEPEVLSWPRADDDPTPIPREEWER
jgi:hypothetical protein